MAIPSAAGKATRWWWRPTTSAPGTIDRDGIPYSDKLTVVERIRRVSPTRMEIETTLTDPEAFLAPYTIRRAYTPMAPGSRFEEYLCENNRDL